MPAASIEIFNYGDHVVRTVDVNGQPWFVALDVCDVLGYDRVSNALRLVDADDLGTHIVSSNGAQRAMQTVNEAGLYDLILRSRRPDARQFKRWVTHEVLPSIRRTGSYGVPAPRTELTNRELALMVLAEADRADLAERKVAELEPAAQEFHRWQTSPDTVYVVEWAKTIGLTQQEAFHALRDLGVLFKQQHEGVAFNVPKRGWEQHFVLIDEWLPGPKRWTKTPKLTAEGQVVLAELLLENGWISR